MFLYWADNIFTIVIFTKFWSLQNSLYEKVSIPKKTIKKEKKKAPPAILCSEL